MEVILEVLVEVFIVQLLMPILRGIAMMSFEVGFLIYGLLGQDWSEKRKESISGFLKIVISILGASLFFGLVFYYFYLKQAI